MKIVVFMKNWLGDTFFQLPAIRHIAERRPGAEITCIAPPRCRELLETVPNVKHVIEFDEKSTHRSWLKRLAFVRELRARGPFEEGYLFHRSKTRALLLVLAGVKKRLGYGKGRSLWLTKSVHEPASDLHHVDYFLELLYGCGFNIPENSFYEIPVTPVAAEKANALLREAGIAGETHFAAFHLGANWEPKRWPPENFAALADLLHDQWQLPVVVTGSLQDQPLLDAMTAFVKRARVFSLVGRTPLDVLSAVYSQASFVVSGDSGPMHVAAAVGTRVAALFGPTNPDLTGPRGRGEAIVLKYVPEGYAAPYFGDAAIAKTWLEKIKPGQVFEEIKKKGWIR